MEKFLLEKDITLICLRANSFPAGIAEAQEQLQQLFNPQSDANYYGISYLYDDAIVYFAGVEVPAAPDNFPPQCEKYILRRGEYISILIPGFRHHLSRIQEAFDLLLNDPDIDPNGCCAEMYLPTKQGFDTAQDIRCMVRLAD